MSNLDSDILPMAEVIEYLVDGTIPAQTRMPIGTEVLWVRQNQNRVSRNDCSMAPQDVNGAEDIGSPCVQRLQAHGIPV